MLKAFTPPKQLSCIVESKLNSTMSLTLKLIEMKTKQYVLLAIMAAALSVLSIDRVRNALFFDTKIAYADPEWTLLPDANGTERVVLVNTVPDIKYKRPSKWETTLGVTYKMLEAKAGVNHEALSDCKIAVTYCAKQKNNMCPMCYNGNVFLVLPGSRQWVQMLSSPF